VHGEKAVATKNMELVSKTVVVIGIFLTVIGGILWFYQERVQVAGIKYPTMSVVRPYTDAGHLLVIAGLLVIISGIVIFAFGYLVKRSKGMKREGV